MLAGQFTLGLLARPRSGGARRGAGRKPAPGRRPCVAHRARPPLDARHPVLVTLRARRGVDWLRERRVYAALERAIASSSHAWFRVAHFSVQTDHVHLIVEVDGAHAKGALARGLRGLAIRLALAANRARGWRGSVWGDRYHARALGSPREVRHALVYVLANARKHLRAVAGLDPCSSARWFDGWRVSRSRHDSQLASIAPIVEARTWLLRCGWRRHGLLSVDEAPAR